MSYRIGIDVGGTFTDFLVVSATAARLVPQDQLDARRSVARRSLHGPGGDRGAARARRSREIRRRRRADRARHDGDDERRAHRRGARTGLLATEGLPRRARAARRHARGAATTTACSRPTPLVPRYLRLPRRRARRLRRRRGRRRSTRTTCARPRETFARRGRRGGRDLASCTRRPTPAHERGRASSCASCCPTPTSTASSELLPQVRLLRPHVSTTVLNAYVGPIITRYLARARRRGSSDARLRRRAADHAVERRRRDARGGRRAGRAVAALGAGRRARPPGSGSSRRTGVTRLHHDRHGRHELRRGARSRTASRSSMTDGVVDRWRIALPMIDIHTIGAGGGIDRAGSTRAGCCTSARRAPAPSPGPACYGRGGTQPDRHRRRPRARLPGRGLLPRRRMQLDRDAAARAIDEHVARAARASRRARRPPAIYDIVNVDDGGGRPRGQRPSRARPARLPARRRGRRRARARRRDRARSSRSRCCVVPRESSIFCAAGMLMSDFKHDFVRAYKSPLAGIDDARLRRPVRGDGERRPGVLEREGVAAAGVSMRKALDLRYVGQWHELTVPIESTDVDRQSSAAFGSAARSPLRLLLAGQPGRGPGRADDGARPTAKPPMTPLGGDGTTDAEGARVGTRPARDPDARELRETPVYAGVALGAGARLDGPAIVELANTTIVVLAGVPALRRRLRHVRPGHRRRARGRWRRASPRRCGL